MNAPDFAIVPATRMFLYNGRTLADPDPTMAPDAVKNFYAMSGAPELMNASIEGGEFVDGVQTFRFRRGTGDKG